MMDMMKMIEGVIIPNRKYPLFVKRKKAPDEWVREMYMK